MQTRPETFLTWTNIIYFPKPDYWNRAMVNIAKLYILPTNSPKPKKHLYINIKKDKTTWSKLDFIHNK